MPEVGGKHFPYTKRGRRATAKARKKKNYSSEVVTMAKMMSGS